MKPFYLYKITNSINDKIYIGITSRPSKRWTEHLSKTSKCTKLRNALNKHGRENFKLEIMCVGEEEYIIDLESKAIKVYDSVRNGYNSMSGHPNKNGTQHSEDSLVKISESLKKFYKENGCKNKGASRPMFKDTNAYYISGFWFPDRDTGLAALKINEKTFYRWRKQGTLGEVCHPQSKSICHSFVYVSGFWFPNLIEASSVLSINMERLQLFIRKGDVEAQLVRVGTKSRVKSSTAAIGVNQRENGKFRTVLTYKKIKVLDKSFESESEAAVVFDNHYEDIYGYRPNKTSREDIP